MFSPGISADLQNHLALTKRNYSAAGFSFGPWHFKYSQTRLNVDIIASGFILTDVGTQRACAKCSAAAAEFPNSTF